ncbi:MAG: DUF928 domain-containing protein [Coleofasciculus sp. G3-WIS-01]|uniref:DUF928 domain-containing protein n=1 Tax=Coleofasciculus sp. G3-WIS-01 TaxID=3069528 RepID=UPI0032F2E2F7
MSIITRFLRLPRFRIVVFVLLTLALTLGLAIKLPVKVQAQSESPPLSSLIPEQWEVVPATDSNNDVRLDYRQGVGPCGGCVFPRGTPATTLVPLSGIGKTVAEYPTLFGYIPQANAWGIELRLKDASNQEVYSTKYAFTHYTEENSDGDEVQIAVGTPGIISLTLPGGATRPPLLPPLEIGQQYRWTLRILCQRDDPSGDIYIDGAIERVQLNSIDKRFLAQATPEERLAFYTKERIWYETVDTLIELRRERPDDQDVADAWNKLLKSVELEAYTFLSALS